MDGKACLQDVRLLLSDMDSKAVSAIAKRCRYKGTGKEYTKESRLKAGYNDLIRSICGTGGILNRESRACDEKALAWLSSRVQAGVLVAEIKFKGQPEAYVDSIRSGNREAILSAITDEDAEKAVIKRVSDQCKKLGIDGKAVASFYKDVVIPLTKEVEVEYLMKRLS